MAHRTKPESPFAGDLISTSTTPATFHSFEDRVTVAAPTNLDRFWSSYFRTSFVVLFGELCVGLLYFLWTPQGPHRVELIAICLTSIAVAIAGFTAVHFVAPLVRRAEIFSAWVLFAGLVITWSAHLDAGIKSPLIIMFVLPVCAAALQLSLRYVIICGAATLCELGYVWFADSSRGSATPAVALVAAAVVGTIVFALGVTTARLRLQKEEKRLEAELTYRAETDSLTGCLNHGTFYDRLMVESDRSHRHQEDLSLLMIDVDLFKAFNDAFGHVAGDEALSRVGHVFRDASRSFDVVGRVGGDEFSVILPTTSERDAREVAARLRKRVARDCAPITVSIGVASLSSAALTPSQLVRAADASLYTAKTNGRNQVAAVPPPTSSKEPTHRTVVRSADLRVVEERVRESDRATAEALSVLDAYQASSSVGLGFVDHEFHILRINSMLAGVNGGSVDEQIGRTIEEVVPDLWPQLSPHYHSVIDSAEPVVNLEVSGTTAQDPGVTHWWLTNLIPVTTSDQVIGVGIVVIDISDRKHLEESRIQLTRSVVAALASAAEIRDPYTSGHEDRVATYAVAVARELGLDEEEIEAIRLAANIHDIGKLAIPAEILARPGDLSAEEVALLRTHAQAGSDMLKRVDFPHDPREIVHQHHERLDGSGYPRGLKGDEVCRGAQIVAVVDVFDAMVSNRPYRVSLGVEAALGELAKGSGTKYSAEVVDAFVRLVKANGITTYHSELATRPPHDTELRDLEELS